MALRYACLALVACCLMGVVVLATPEEAPSDAGGVSIGLY